MFDDVHSSIFPIRGVLNGIFNVSFSGRRSEVVFLIDTSVFYRTALISIVSDKKTRLERRNGNEEKEREKEKVKKIEEEKKEWTEGKRSEEKRKRTIEGKRRTKSIISSIRHELIKKKKLKKSCMR